MRIQTKFSLNLFLYINVANIKISPSGGQIFLIVLKIISYNILLKILFWIIPSGYIIHAQVIPDTASENNNLSSPILPERSSRPPFTNDPNYNKILTDAMNLQNIADSLGSLAFEYRQDIMFMDNVYERNKLQYQLGILEDHMRSVQTEADSLFNMLPQIITQADGTSLLILDTIIEGIKVYHYNTEDLSGNDFQTDNSAPPATLPGENNFSISSRPAYSSDHPFEDIFQLPSGTFYRIQLAALSQEVSWERFGGIQPITIEKNTGGEVIKYYAGKFSKYSDAESALVRIRSSGFKDAFIVSYYNGQRMSVEQVREFEKVIR